MVLYSYTRIKLVLFQRSVSCVNQAWGCVCVCYWCDNSLVCACICRFIQDAGLSSTAHSHALDSLKTQLQQHQTLLREERAAHQTRQQEFANREGSLQAELAQVNHTSYSVGHRYTVHCILCQDNLVLGTVVNFSPQCDTGAYIASVVLGHTRIVHRTSSIALCCKSSDMYNTIPRDGCT